MGLFRRRQGPASGIAIAAAGGSPLGANGVNPGTLGSVAERRAIRVPTVSRAHDLHVAMVGALEMRVYTRTFDPQTGRWTRNYVTGQPWVNRPDPTTTRQHILGSTTGDLFHHGRAFWYVTSRYASTGFPAAFEWIPHDEVNAHTPGESGPPYCRIPTDFEINGVEVDPGNVVTFLSPVAGALYQGSTAIDTAERLNTAARRFALNEIPAGYLQQTEGEPMDGEALAELAAAWANNRQAQAIGALNKVVKWEEFDSDPNKLQLTEGREYSALELARVANIPPYLAGVETGGMVYQNAQQARQDLYLFGSRVFVDTIQETLSANSILPNGQYLELDVKGWLEELADMQDADRPTTRQGASDEAS